MKQRNRINASRAAVLAGALLACGTAYSYSSGPPPRHTGAPGDDPAACTACHLGKALNGGPGKVEIVLPGGSSYTPGVTQHIAFHVSDPQQRRWGFQMTARVKTSPMNGQAGDFHPADGFTQVICDDGNRPPCAMNAAVQFIEHTTAGTRLGSTGGVTFEFDWTPPAADAGSIVFYVAANAANGDGNLTGDRIYTSSVELASAIPPPATNNAVPVSAYVVHNLTSDIPGLADQTDSNLVNPWGMTLSPTGGFWTANNHTGFATVYDGNGLASPAANPLVVNTGSPASSPTGVVFNGTRAFELTPGNPALFLFASEPGTVSGWSPAVDPANVKVMVDQSGAGAVYKGLAVGANASGPLLYAANFNSGSVDVFDSHFQPVVAPGGFKDPNLPPGFAPFNIQKIGRRLYVTYAMQDGAKHDDVAGAGNGFINAFDADGNLLQRLVSNGPLNSPWGIGLAPGFFGDYSEALLVGNFGDGTINAFDPFTGAWLGALQDSSGKSIQVPGLWALQFGNGHMGGDANTLYFTAGIANGGNVEDHGLFGSIRVAQ